MDREYQAAPIPDSAKRALVRTGEAAKILDVKKSTMESWRCRGGGPPFVRYGRAIRYREEDLDRFIENNIHANTSEYPKTPQDELSE